METKRAAGREGAQPDSGVIWQASDRSSGPFRPTPSGQACPGAVERRNAQTGDEPRLSRSSSHSIPDKPVSILISNGSAP